MTNRLQYLTQLLESSPNDPFLLFAIAKEYEKNSDDASALLWYERLKNTRPDYVGLYYHLGKLFERLGNHPAAISVYKTGADVARSAKDNHALAEINGALMEIDDDY
jgi:tetratricopeptide (TPR) repeat protein